MELGQGRSRLKTGAEGQAKAKCEARNQRRQPRCGWMGLALALVFSALGSWGLPLAQLAEGD